MLACPLSSRLAIVNWRAGLRADVEGLVGAIAVPSFGATE
jgi:hypothetical protein